MRFSDLDLQSLASGLLPIMEEAGRKILSVYYREGDATVWQKDDKSPLTEADKAAHEVIVAGLAFLSPDIPILSEEGAHLGFEDRQHWECNWLVDPLDGTKEFLKRNGEFTVNIALIGPGGIPYVAGVSAPALDKTYLAVKNAGAFRIEKDGQRVRLQSPKVDEAAEGLRIVCSRSHMTPEVAGYVEQFVAPELVSMGSSLKFLMIAENQADIYPRLAPTMEWDTAAAQFILEEAGGSVVVYPENAPMVYNKENLLNPWFIARGA